jgi:hypothetical protein
MNLVVADLWALLTRRLAQKTEAAKFGLGFPSIIKSAESSALANRMHRSRRRGLAAEGVPCLHQLAPSLQGITAAIGLLDGIADRMRQGGFANLTREGGRFTAPIAETRPKAVRGGFDVKRF